MSAGLRYCLLLLLLAALVWWQPILWEVGLVGVLAGTAWLLSRPDPAAASEDVGEVPVVPEQNAATPAADEARQ